MRFLPLLLLLTSCATTNPASAATRAMSTPYPSGMIEIKDVDEASLIPVTKKFDELVAQGDKTIMFRINSFGGSIFGGLDFIQHIEEAKKQNRIFVYCVVDTKAMSMGFAFLQSFCDERLMTKRSVLLAHNGSTMARGNSDQIEEARQMILALSEALAEQCAARLKISVKEYKAKIEKNAWTMAWEEALKVGAIDGTIDPMLLPPLHELPPPPDPLMLLLGLEKK